MPHIFILNRIIDSKIHFQFTSSTSKSTLRDEKSFCSVNSEFENESVSESGRSIYETEVNRSIIIEKDSKIIALENEVEVNKNNFSFLNKI